MKAKWNDEIIAACDKTEVVEGNHYFPKESVNQEFLRDSTHESYCPWKGTASYYHIKVGDKVNENAAWIYKEPKSAASNIKDHIAFWKGVEIEE